MAQLHQLLAVESDLEGVFKRSLSETSGIFNRPDAFQGWHERFEVTVQDAVAPESDKRKELITTVPAVLNEMAGHTVRFLDAVLQKEATNQQAVAPIIIDGTEITQPLPATFLLGLETKLKNIRKSVAGAPVLDPGIAWDVDTDQGKGVRKRRFPGIRTKGKKTVRHEVLVAAVIKEGVGLPAQIEKWNEDIPVGTYTKNEWTGMITPAEKAAVLGRLDKLARAVKRARTVANETEVVKAEAGDAVMKFILG